MLTHYSKDTRIGVIAGGFSGEREVSLRSGNNVLAALLRKGYNATLVDPAQTDLSQAHIDVAFLVLHGTFGEDGCIQAYLSHLGIPYTGSGTDASILGMNKLMTKTIMKSHGLPTPDFRAITHLSFEVPWAFPVIVKPLAEGSSLGVTIADTLDECRTSVAKILDKYGICLIEEYIEGRELTVGVLDHDNKRQALPILELKPDNRFYDYDAKYTPGKTTFILPAPLPDGVRDALQSYAIRLHEVLGCAGATRTDMLFHKERGAFLLEINTAPGMTDQSDLPAQAETAGIPFDDLVEIILCSANYPK
jgi:D-alanine-D-alanine ligase